MQKSDIDTCRFFMVSTFNKKPFLLKKVRIIIVIIYLWQLYWMFS